MNGRVEKTVKRSNNHARGIKEESLGKGKDRW